MADRTETLILDFEIDESDSVESINSITKASKALREERSKLNLQSVEGQKRVKEINAELDKNNSKIKDNVSALEKQRINVGNYKSALDGVHPALGKVGQGLEAGTQGFKAMTLQALRFIATPIGAILAAIVAVFTLLKTAISSNNELLDKFENITNAIGQVVTILTNRLGKLGEAFIALVSFDLDKAIDLTAEAFGGLADEIGRAVGEGQVLLEMSRDLEDAQRQLRIEQAKQENVIKQLVVASKNRNLTLDQQEEKLKEALRLEQGLVKVREDLAAKELEIAVRQLAVDENIQQQQNENFQQFAERLIKMSKLSDAQVDPLVEKIEKLEAARGSSLAFQEKLENSLSAIQEKRAAALEKQNKALEEQAALERAVRRAQNVSDTSVEDPLVGAFETQLEITEDFNERINKANNEAYLEDVRNKRKAEEQKADITELNQQRQLQTLSTFAEAGLNVLDQQSSAFKALATFQTLISTYSTAQKAYEAAFVPPTIASPALGIANVALAIAQGLANVAAINGIQFAEGGYTGPGGKWDVAGIVHKDEYVVNKSTRQRPEAQPHLMALERMRLGQYADGGLVTSSISTPINQQLEIANIIKNMPAPVVGVKEVTKMQNRVRVKEQASKR